jgi:hypothetical protein
MFDKFDNKVVFIRKLRMDTSSFQIGNVRPV